MHIPSDEGLTTPRLKLRFPVMEDAQNLARQIGVAEVAMNLATAPYPYSLDDAAAWIEQSAQDRDQGKAYAFVIEHAQHGLIGGAGIHHKSARYWEIGYWLAVPFWGQGYITEAAREVLTWGKTRLGVAGYVAGHFDDNPASGQVLRKLGFTKVGHIHQASLARPTAQSCSRYVWGAPAEIALAQPAH